MVLSLPLSLTFLYSSYLHFIISPSFHLLLFVYVFIPLTTSFLSPFTDIIHTLFLLHIISSPSFLFRLSVISVGPTLTLHLINIPFILSPSHYSHSSYLPLISVLSSPAFPLFPTTPSRQHHPLNSFVCASPRFPFIPSPSHPSLLLAPLVMTD